MLFLPCMAISIIAPRTAAYASRSTMARSASVRSTRPASAPARCPTSPQWTKAPSPGKPEREHTECNAMKTDGLSINLATVRQQFDLKTGVEACLRHGITAISPWRDHVQATGVAEAARIIRSNGLKVTGYCRGGLFAASDAAGRQAAIDDNKTMIDEAAAIGADCIVMIGGGLPKGSRNIKAARQMF